MQLSSVLTLSWNVGMSSNLFPSNFDLGKQKNHMGRIERKKKCGITGIFFYPKFFNRQQCVKAFCHDDKTSDHSSLSPDSFFKLSANEVAYEYLSLHQQSCPKPYKTQMCHLSINLQVIPQWLLIPTFTDPELSIIFLKQY